MELVLTWNNRKDEPCIQVYNEEYYCWDTEDGKLWLYIGKPYIYDYEFRTDLEKGSSIICSYNFKAFDLNEKDYTNLKWEDNPIEVFLNMED